MGLGVKDQRTAISCWTARSLKTGGPLRPVRFMHAKHASPDSRTAPCATTIGHWTKRLGNRPLLGLPPGTVQCGPSGTAGAQSGLPPAVHGLPPEMNKGPIDCRLPPKKRARPQGSDPTGGQPGTVPGHLRVPALPQGSRRGHALHPPTGCGKALRLTPMKHRKEVTARQGDHCHSTTSE
jgi:hypothetical protein